MEYQLSIIIVNYNAGGLLMQCVESVRRTTEDFADPKCEVVVIDNASDDESLTKIQNTSFFFERAKLKIKNYSSKFEIIKNKKNLGFARAVNQGIRKRQGEYVLLLNPDTIVSDGAIKGMLEFAREMEDAGVVGARLLNPDGSVQPSVFHLPSIFSAMAEFWFGVKDAHSKYVPVGDGSISVDALVGAAFLITPRAIARVGMLDEEYFMYFEDLDYCRKVKSAGLRVYYLPQFEVVHYHGVSGRTLAPVKEQWKRLIPSSIKYHGFVRHYIIHFVLWTGQKLRKILK